MTVRVRERRLWQPPSTATSFSPYSSAYPQPLEAVWAGDAAGGWTNGVAVASARNGGSRGSGPLVQATGANQPLFRSVGIGLRPSFQFDGTNDVLDVDIADIAQPYKLVCVAKFNVLGLGSGHAVMGVGPASSHRVGMTSANNIGINAGTGLFDPAAQTSTGTHVIVCTVNGASSSVRLDGVLVASGAAGADAVERFTVGASNGSVVLMNGHVGYAAVYASTADTTQLEADLIAHYTFNPLTQVPGILHGVWASDPSWSHPADGAAVASWRNQSGGGDPAQATGSAQPLWRLAGINNQPSVQFDGTDDVLSALVTSIPTPHKIVLVAKPNNLTPSFQTILGRGQSSAFHGIATGNGPGANFNVNLGANITTNVPADTNPHVWRVSGDGTAASTITIDSASTTGLVNFNLLRVLLGAGSESTPIFSQFFNGHIAYVGIFPGATSDQDLATLVTSLKTFYQIP